MKKSKLSITIGLILTGTVFSMSASATTMYNTYNAYHDNIGTDGLIKTDGWTYDFVNNNRNITHAWAGTNNATMPFDLTNNDVPVLNWAVNLTSPGSGATVSSQNAHDLYGVWADIDTTSGAWSDGNTGAAYSMDVGLLKSDHTQQITLTASNVDPSGWQNFGVNIYTGSNQMHAQTVYAQTGTTCCDQYGNPVPVYSQKQTNLADYNHHEYWNIVSDPTQDNPLNTYGLNYLTHGEHSSVTFTANAGEVYAIVLGGYILGDSPYSNSAGYAVNITSSPVPIPNAIWLFGSGLMALPVLQRRKPILKS